MTVERAIATAFRLTDETWARHANPWSVWTRNTALPLLTLAIWSRVWLGWGGRAAVRVVLLWIWLNPRLFPAPRTTTHWASRAVLGERVWLNRDQIPVPVHHRRAPHLLSAVAALGLPLIAWGLLRLEAWPLLVGCAFVYAGKLWFLDRMVWLYQDMMDVHPQYRSWLY